MTNQFWELEFYEDEYGRAACRDWLESLPDARRAAVMKAFELVLRVHGLNVCATEWGKQLGEGLFEFRIRHSAPAITRMFGSPSDVDNDAETTGVLLRVFCHAYGNRIVLLLDGYDKGRNPDKKRQEKEIKAARKLLADFQTRRRKWRK